MTRDVNLGRRAFLTGLAGGVAALEAKAWSFPCFWKSDSDFDENLAVFLSDVHVSGRPQDPAHMFDNLQASVAEILRMSPLPRHVLVFGDLAYLWGSSVDYRRSQPVFKLLVDAGIDVRLTTGNHDHRAAFADTYPEYAVDEAHVIKSPVPGKAVSVVEFPSCDFILFDSLQEAVGKRDNPVQGALSADEYEWMKAELPKWQRPFFLGAHHGYQEIFVRNENGEPVKGTGLGSLLTGVDAFAGYVHGHDHQWKTRWLACNMDSKVRWQLGLPSSGFWGDIGYAIFRTTPGTAEAEFVQRDFFFPRPLPPGKERPASWDDVAEAQRHARCLFRF